MNFFEKLKSNKSLFDDIGFLDKIRNDLFYIPVMDISKKCRISKDGISKFLGKKISPYDIDQDDVYRFYTKEKYDSRIIHNFGIIVSRCKNLFIIDIDKYKLTQDKLKYLSDNSESFNSKYSKLLELLENTYTVRSQSNGRHHYFLYDGIESYRFNKIKNGIDVKKFLSEDKYDEFIKKFNFKNPEELEKNKRYFDIDFFAGKQLLILPHCKFNELTNKNQRTEIIKKSYEILNNIEIKQLRESDFDIILDVFNNIYPIFKKEIKNKSVNVTISNKVNNNIRVDYEEDQERYSREINLLNNFLEYKGLKETGFTFAKYFEPLMDKSLSYHELKEKIDSRKKKECSWIRRGFYLGISKSSLQKFARENFNQHTHSYSDPSFIVSFYDKLVSNEDLNSKGEIYIGKDKELYDCINLIGSSDLKPLFGRRRESCTIVLIALYSIGILNNSFNLRYLSIGMIMLLCRRSLHYHSVRNTLDFLIESKIIFKDFFIDETENTKIITYNLMNKEELSNFLSDNKIIQESNFNVFLSDSRIALNKINGIGKQGEKLYLQIRNLEKCNFEDLYLINHHVSHKNRRNMIHNPINKLIKYNFLQIDNNYIMVTNKPLSDCEKIIEDENILLNRKRKLSKNPIKEQLNKAINKKDDNIDFKIDVAKLKIFEAYENINNININDLNKYEKLFEKTKQWYISRKEKSDNKKKEYYSERLNVIEELKFKLKEIEQRVDII
jgi:hypothetical protein